MDQTINTETEAAAANRTSLLDVVLNSVEQSGKVSCAAVLTWPTQTHRVAAWPSGRCIGSDAN